MIIHYFLSVLNVVRHYLTKTHNMNRNEPTAQIDGHFLSCWFDICSHHVLVFSSYGKSNVLYYGDNE